MTTPTPQSQYGYLHVVQALFGDALMLEYADGQKSGFMLIDGGPGKSYGTGSRTTGNLFKLLDHLSRRNSPRQLESIDTVVVTHDDEDHKNGIADLFKYLLDLPKKPQGDWPMGQVLMNKGTQPITNIWYNSQANLISDLPLPSRVEKYQDGSGNPLAGWFDSLLRQYNQKFPQHQPITFNHNFGGQKLVTVEGQTPVAKGQFDFEILGPSLRDLKKPNLIDELIKTSNGENKRAPDKFVGPGQGEGSLIDTVSASCSLDSSAKNRSSIAFIASDKRSNAAVRPKLLMLGDAAIASSIPVGEYEIIKIAHHGSCHNNYLSSRTPSHGFKIKVPNGILQRAFAFFYDVRAKKYVISASPSYGSPNPHITTILGIYLAAVERATRMDVYLTNELPENVLLTFKYFVLLPDDTKYPGDTGDQYILDRDRSGKNLTQAGIIDRLKQFDKHMRIWLLRPDIAFGSIPIYDADPDVKIWERYKEDITGRNDLRAEAKRRSKAMGQSALSGQQTSPPPKLQRTAS